MCYIKYTTLHTVVYNALKYKIISNYLKVNLFLMGAIMKQTHNFFSILNRIELLFGSLSGSQDLPQGIKNYRRYWFFFDFPMIFRAVWEPLEPRDRRKSFLEAIKNHCGKRMRFQHRCGSSLGLQNQWRMGGQTGLQTYSIRKVQCCKIIRFWFKCRIYASRQR